MKKSNAARKSSQTPLGTVAAQAQMTGDLATAEKHYRTLLKQHARNAPLLAALGKVCLDQHKYDDAIGFLKKAIKYQPEDAKSVYNIGLALHRLSRYDEALTYYQKALKINPSLYGAHNNSASLYFLKHNYGEAIQHLKAAIEISPYDAKAFSNLALAYSEVGQIEVASDYIQKAIALDPEAKAAHSNLLLNFHYESKLSAEALYKEHLKWAHMHAVPLQSRLLHHNDKQPNRRLRIGYVSPDFRVHSVAYFFVPLLKSHKADEFEIYCYSDTDKPDALTDHIKSMSHQWRETRLMSDEELSRQIQQDQIDILVELTGHTADNRLKALSYKPAPIQVSYLGYPDTTGLDTMDYRFCDKWSDPAGLTDPYYSEKLLRLHHGFLCYQAPSNVPELSQAPFHKNGYVTFGSFNTLRKITDEVLTTWSTILKRVPGSKLLIKAGGLNDEATRTYYRQRLVEQGIDEERLILHKPTSTVIEHLDVYAEVDIALDTFPYNGTTTTCEAMWMGVPVITVEGDTHVSRVGTSIMHQAGLVDLIAPSKEAYVELACRLAGDTAIIDELRGGLRAQLQHSPLTDAKGFTEEVESAYRQIWQDYCSTPQEDATKQPPDKHAAQTLNIHTRLGVDLQFSTQHLNPVIGPFIETSSWYPPEGVMLGMLFNHTNHVLDYEPSTSVFLLAYHEQLKDKTVSVCVEKDNPALEQVKTTLKVMPNGQLVDSEKLDEPYTACDLIHFESIEHANDFVSAHGKLLTAQQPTIVISPESDIHARSALILAAESLQYRFFRYTPFIGKLTPVVFSTEATASTRSALFCIPEARIDALYSDNLLIREVAETELPDDRIAWQTYLNQYDYAQPYLKEWQDAAAGQAFSEHYFKAISMYIKAMDVTSDEEKYHLLLAAFEHLIPLIDQYPTLPRLLSAARIAAELGLRDSASDILSLIIEHISKETELELDEAFLAPLARYEDFSPDDRLDQWLLAAVLEAYERNRCQSFVNSNHDDLYRLQVFESLNFPSPFMQKRLALLNEIKNFLPEVAETDTLEAPRDTTGIAKTGKPDIAILYHLARTGGTLISKCLGSIQGNILLSEIHPLISVMSPLEQARQWHHLLEESDYRDIVEGDGFNYKEALKRISQKAVENDAKVIVRDWSHIDFTAVPFVDQPTYQLTQTELLKDDFNIHQFATVRHPLDTYLSLSKLAIMQDKLSIQQYLTGCKQFALKAREIGFVRYEDFCREPKAVLKQICDALQVNYNDEFLEKFSSYTHITGEVAGGRGAGSEIKVPRRNVVSPELENAFKENQDYWDTLEILGYQHELQ